LSWCKNDCLVLCNLCSFKIVWNKGTISREFVSQKQSRKDILEELKIFLVRVDQIKPLKEIAAESLGTVIGFWWRGNPPIQWILIDSVIEDGELIECAQCADGSALKRMLTSRQARVAIDNGVRVCASERQCVYEAYGDMTQQDCPHPSIRRIVKDLSQKGVSPPLLVGERRKE